jgi:hypothetical protein
MFRCPVTTHRIDAGVNTDENAIDPAWDRAMRVYCRWCSAYHELPVRESYLEGDSV